MVSIEQVKEIRDLLLSVNALSYKFTRTYVYKKVLKENNIEDIIDNFLRMFNSEQEGWYCIAKLCIPPMCNLCGKEICKFGEKRYCLTCKNCSSNQLPSKIRKFKNTISNKTQQEKKQTLLKREQTCTQLYNDPHYGRYGSESFKKNMLEKYGDEHYNNHAKTLETNLKRYNVECTFQIEGYVEKAIQTKIEKYGNASNYQKTKETNLKKRGVEHIGQCKEVIEKMQASKLSRILEFERRTNTIWLKTLVSEYGSKIKYITDSLETYTFERHTYVHIDSLPIIEDFLVNNNHKRIIKNVSEGEKELCKFISSIYNGRIIVNDRKTIPIGNDTKRCYEIDIFLPDLNIGIEYDGNYYHSTVFKDKLYHQRKTLLAYSVGVSLAHVPEFFWDTDRTNIELRLKDLILNKKSNSDGFFPTLNITKGIQLGEPNVHIFNGHEYYDTGNIIEET